MTSSEYVSISEWARIVESYFTPDELARFMALDPSQRDEAFMRGWTRKEAILKAKGVGLAGLATAFETMFGTTTLLTEFTPAAPLPRVGDWSLWEPPPAISTSRPWPWLTLVGLAGQAGPNPRGQLSLR